MTPAPIFLITALCVALTFGTMWIMGLILRDLNAGPFALASTYVMMNAFPGFFAWSFWSLMDITPWVFAITLAVWACLRSTMTGCVGWALILAVIALPLIRPEGIVLVIGLALFIAIAPSSGPRRIKRASMLIGAAMVSLAAVTAWRMWVFGYPAPNTFYAKTSPDLLRQAIQGAEYVVKYLWNPVNALLITGIVAAAVSLSRSVEPSRRLYALCVPYLAGGGMLVYMILGGDHFGSFRFFLFILPIALPMIALWLARIQTLQISTGVVLAVYTILACAMFARDGGTAPRTAHCRS